MYNLLGQTFGRLTVLGRDPAISGFRKEAWWICKCTCGGVKSIRSYLLRKGVTKSCGCLREEAITRVDNTKHGYYNSRTYHTWEGMKQRCLNEKAENYYNYGGKGVSICEEWMEFENFLADMGDRPAGRTLDRIDPYGNYEPNNCRWATPKEQANNQRRHKMSEEVTSLC